jgi:1-acyl-sn-glycerol-3-phosphate acyltransferase
VIASLRALYRLLLALPITAWSYGWALAASILLRRWPQRRVREQGRAYRWWSRGLCRVFGVRVRVTGEPPRAPFFLVSNHLSYLDILVLGTQIPCVFVAKAEIDRWPLFGALCRSVNTIFIDRKAKRSLPRVLAEIEIALAAGQGVVIFPEGTSGAGHEVMPFRSPLLDLPARLGYPVHWAALTYRVPEDATPAHLSVTWWGDMPLAPHVGEMLRLPWIEASLAFGPAPIAEPDRKRLAEQLRLEIEARFEPVVERSEIERLLALRESDPASLPRVLVRRS